MRKTLAAAAALALLVVLYAAAGYWIAPGYVREALAELAASHGLTLGLTTVRTKPFALRVELGGIALRGPQGRVFAEAESASADLAWASLWRRGWLVEQVRLVSPQVALGKLPERVESANASGGKSPAITIRQLVVENGRLRYAAQDLVLEAFTLHARDLSTLDAAAGTYEAAARLADGAGQAASRGTLALMPLAAEGTLSVAALRAAQLLPQAQGQLEGSARYVYAGGNLTLREVSLAGNGLAYAGIELPQATLEAPQVPIPPQQPFQVGAQASVAPQGKVAAQGKLGFAPLRMDLNVAAQALPLAQAQRWLPEHVAVRIASGALSGNGRLQIASDSTAYQGSAAIRDLRLEERASDTLLLAWQRAETDALDISFSPFSLAIGEVLARAPEGRLVIAQDGSVNFARVIANGEGDGEPPRVTLERLRIEQGTLHFADRSLANPFEVAIRELSGGITGFSTAASEPARVRLNGRVQPYGVARIRGTINLDAPTTLADITANFRNLRLEAFNPYIAKFAGYRIESGRLSAELRYEVRDGRLVGTNQLAFENMQLGEKLEEKGLLDVPLELAVALLADSKGRIDLDIPVRGNLNDPQFDIGAIVARAFGNVLKKIVTAPFRALASLFGGKEQDRDPGAVAFQPGSAALSPPEEEKVAQVARALEQRPKLGIEVHGGYDPARDLEALRLRTARQELARAAGVQALDLSDPKVVRAAEDLYLKRAGDRAALEALRKSDARYGRVLLQHIAAAMPVDETAVQALARERADAVRAALLDHGVEPGRVSVAQPAAPQGAAEGIKTTLSLTAGFTAETDPVREAQRKLNAAGFEAGPVDGILGPRTRRALIKYQGANGLEPTGELDTATRERLL